MSTDLNPEGMREFTLRVFPDHDEDFAIQALLEFLQQVTDELNLGLSMTVFGRKSARFLRELPHWCPIAWDAERDAYIYYVDPESAEQRFLDVVSATCFEQSLSNSVTSDFTCLEQIRKAVEMGRQAVEEMDGELPDFLNEDGSIVEEHQVK